MGPRLWSADRFTFPLPPGHRFPLPKYALLRRRVIADGLAPPEAIIEPPAAAWDDLALVHAPEWLERIRRGTLSEREQRVIGLPWSPALVERTRRAAQGTVEAARDAVRAGVGMNLGGGTHHAGRASARGYCLVNDVALAVAVMRREDRADRVLVVDCDVHQGDGTAEIFASDPRCLTLSVNGARNFPFPRTPSDLDVELASGTGDEGYLAALAAALERMLERAAPDLVVFLAGADPWHGDALGRLAVSKAGLRARDELVLARAAEAGAACCVVLAGGYAPDVADTVDINAATVRAVLARARRGEAPSRLFR